MVKSQKNSRIQSPDQEYLQALRLYWQNEKEGALSLLSERLADGKSQQPHLYYRLWIESLAEDQDESSLRILQRHIQRHINYQHPSWIGLYALTGLIHYELGELEAGRILQRKLERHTSDPYSRELSLVLGPELPDEDQLQIAKGMIKVTADYFVLRRAALLGVRLQDATFSRKVMDTLQDRIGESPLGAEIGFHKQFSVKQYRKAWQFARFLREVYPLNSQYQFYFAYTSYLIDRNRTALEEFLKLNRRAQEGDPDVLCMIGATLLQSGRKTMSDKLRKRSEYYLEKARLRLKSQGLPTDYPTELLLRINDNEDVPNSGRHWIVKLSAKQCYDLYQKPEHRIEYLHRAMGPYVKTGDVCMFVSESRVADNQDVGIWRLNAIYKALSDPEWHPTHRWQTILKLQMRMEVSIPLEIEGNQKERLPDDGPHRYGLYEIDDSAMVWIEDSVRTFTLDDQAFVQVFAELKLARSV
ncbi:MAG TPA: hypothetical protein VE954_03260 [Oligoflexus sp.]|uniref:hypothetical protein n=1 Tax=Oligoflexus sp. TaxID=1971216 RepID=UPI002D411B5A|nr:hypothetical protein [Oligoflexus sp.]HYX32106.1 hypothetical protein [Oligoflexus sp.]